MILLVDNNDSYTYNLHQLICQLAAEPVEVVRAQDIATSDSIPDLMRDGHVSHVVISPGPGHPGRARDFAGSRVIIDAARGIPLLGVCLGHQGLGLSHGARVINAPQARHGYVSTLSHTGRGLFAGIPQDFRVVRYHSLHVVHESTLHVHARSEDGLVMAFRVPGQQHWGVQFHPESILTEHGDRLLANFLKTAAHRRPGGGSPAPLPVSAQIAVTDPIPRSAVVLRPDPPTAAPVTRQLTLHAKVRSIVVNLDTEATFRALTARHPRAPLFWVDPDQASGHGPRYSILGAAAGPSSQTIRYRVDDRTAFIRTGEEMEELQEEDVFALLQARIANTRVTGLPAGFPFPGGYLGYFGYELKSLLLGPNRHRSNTPDAYWLCPESFIVYDHAEHTAHTVWMGAEEDLHSGRPESELEALAQSLRGAGALPRLLDGAPDPDGAADGAHPVSGAWRLSHDQYLARIERSQRLLHAGESYEICLTDRFEGKGSIDGLAYYCALRRANPAPYAAYFRFPEFGDRIEIMSASPERFLTIGADRVIESKPIKGTAPRSPDPHADELVRELLRTDPKTRAENLMIVDLLRNDLGRVCVTGSVTVPTLMDVESHPAVHQLVSTIRGRLLPELDAIDAIRASFPGGSMTGAPKMRTVEIIDALEVGARGIYSGSIGYLAFDGSADLNIAIRTLVRDGDRWNVGAGGAIVLDSDPNAEYEEKNLKAEKLLQVMSMLGTAPEGGL